MLKFLAILIFSFILMPAFADTCTPTTYSNGTVVYCFTPVTPTQQVQTSPMPSFVPNTGTIKDYFSTLFNKLQSSSQQSGLGNPQFGNVTSEAKKAIISGIDLFSSVKYLIAALMGWVAPTLLGYSLPNWVVPLMVWSMVGLTLYFVFKHIWKIVMTGLIIAIAIFIFLLFGSNLILLH